ncbi:hypothetical protein L2E82_41689 [Cichorium intybus]|uniref:Uncharacterized protein n=1 Tax=Cichorium intybus TaxID=13427 RepID=A0ACB8ZKW8_CICIN|nr:hypothetical protein L2E82_41689 [Cichorium intybus]
MMDLNYEDDVGIEEDDDDAFGGRVKSRRDEDDGEIDEHKDANKEKELISLSFSTSLERFPLSPNLNFVPLSLLL